jgi:hypothetical protein
MRHIVATLIVGVMLVLVSGAIDAHGQDGCSFVGGFARLRDLVGAEKVGDCQEDEHFNADNGNTEQRTTGGMMVWRKADNFTAFTDGGTTWLMGPDGLQSRPNGERFSWEADPATLASAASPAAASTPGPTSTPSGAVAPAASSPGTSLLDVGAATTPTLTTVAAASPAAVASPVALAPTATPTKVVTPTPAVTAKFTEKPDNVRTGEDITLEVETNVTKKANCVFYVTYRGSTESPLANVEVEHNKCEFTFNVPKDTKTGKANVKAVVNSPEGTAAIDDDFDLKKGDATLTGNVEVKLEAIDLPDDDVEVGDEFKVTVDTDYKKEGLCDLAIAWPKIAATAGEQKTPDGDGRCSWKVTVPAEIPKRGTATLTVVVRKNDKKNNDEVRALTKEFDVKK